MESTSSFLDALRNGLLSSEAVTKFSPNRRFSMLFSEGDPAENMYYLDSGLVKLYKRNGEGKEIIIQIVAPGELFGEQALGENGTRGMSAEILHEGVLHVIPRVSFIQFCNENPEHWHAVSELLITRKRELEKKIELLCLQDVEYRILFYLAELAGMFGVRNGEEFSVPLSQGELASLIGATRETTSTTLNSLSRRGLIRLGRRQVILSSMDGVTAAAADRAAKAATTA
ncbi:MAG: Crp/Fnr family transcriptional regulator [Acidobacteriota bacterium]|nr:Crp/Fnr family transcriptional regulator [Acidobacteriota bacterium]